MSARRISGPKNVQRNSHAAGEDDRLRVEQAYGAASTAPSARIGGTSASIARASPARALSTRIGAVAQPDADRDAIERPARTAQLEPPVPILLRINEIRGGPTE